MVKKLKIGITGHTGYIGSNLIKYLESKSLELVLIKGDLTDPSIVEKSFKLNNIETVIHLAGSFNPPLVNLMNKNVITTFNLIDVGMKHGLKKIIYLSSAAVYGEPNQNKSLESDIPQPNTEYGLSKFFAENIIKYFSIVRKLRYVTLRFPGVYGKGGRGVIDNFIKDINERKAITLYDDGNQKRNFLYIDDACESIYKSIFYKKNDIFNIASTRSFALNEIINKLEQKYAFQVIYKKSNNSLRNITLNTNKAQKELKFYAKNKKIII